MIGVEFTPIDCDHDMHYIIHSLYIYTFLQFNTIPKDHHKSNMSSVSKMGNILLHVCQWYKYAFEINMYVMLFLIYYSLW